jgi:hypothetical protein
MRRHLSVDGMNEHGLPQDVVVVNANDDDGWPWSRYVCPSKGLLEKGMRSF